MKTQKELPSIFYDEDTKTYFANRLISDLTREHIKEIALLVRGFSSKKKIGYDFLICDYNERVKGFESFNLGLYDYRDTIRIQIREHIPLTAKLYTFPKPQLKNSRNDFSVYDLADKQRENEIIVNNTVHSFKNQNAHNSISFEDAQLKLQARDLELDTPLDDPMSYLLSLQLKDIKELEEKNKRLLK